MAMVEVVALAFCPASVAEVALASLPLVVALGVVALASVPLVVAPDDVVLGSAPADDGEASVLVPEDMLPLSLGWLLLEAAPVSLGWLPVELD